MKPHEETWTEYMGVNTCGVKRVAQGTTIAVRVPDYPTAKLMAAAPEMARALVQVLADFNRGYRLTPANAEMIRLALVNAGVR